MLQYNTWSIEQQEWVPAEETSLEQQLTFSNDYLCQTAHFEEHYSGAMRLCTYVKDIETPILNISAISVRLHDERLDLNEWQVKQFYRCLHKNQPLLERRFVATSPKGHTLEIIAQRQLLVDKKEAMELHYSVRSINYTGPITIIAVLRGGEDADKWCPLMNHVGDDYCWLWSQMQPLNVQVCCAMDCHMTRNGIAVTQRPIKVEKQDVIGYSIAQKLSPGDTIVLHKRVIVLDSLRHEKDGLIEDTIKCLTNW